MGKKNTCSFYFAGLKIFMKDYNRLHARRRYQEMPYDCGASVAKYLLCLFNFLFFVSMLSLDTCIIVLSFSRHNLITYLLTPWSRVLLEKLTSKLCSMSLLLLFSTTHAAFKAYCAIWVRCSNFRHQASPRVSPCESTQRRKVELWARNVR